MAQNAAAYQLPSRLDQEAQSPRLRAIPGKAQGTVAAPALDSWVKTLTIMAVILVAVIATTCVARVALSNHTVQLMLQAEQTKEQISKARTVGAGLEVQHSLATNPNKVQDRAAAQGSRPSGQVATLEARHGFSAEIQSMMAAAAADQVITAVAQAEAEAAAFAEAAAATPSDAATASAATTEVPDANQPLVPAPAGDVEAQSQLDGIE